MTYISDTQWADGLVEAARDADLLICESSLYNQYKGVVRGHLTAGEAGSIAQEANAKRLVLSHLPHFGTMRILLPRQVTFSTALWNWLKPEKAGSYKNVTSNR